MLNANIALADQVDLSNGLDDESYIEEDVLFDDVPTVVSATRLKQKITDTPVSVTIIDRDMIEASGATEVHELLRYVPGFFSYSIWGSQFGVANHIQPRDVGVRLEVQVNGRSVYEPLFTTVDWPSLGIDVSDIDYIEVIRGSSATTYGSNAFLGAINIITKDAVSRPKASIRTRIGNIGRRELTLNHSGHAGDVDYALSMVYKTNTGFPALDTLSKLRDLENDDRKSLNFSLQGSYIPNLANEIKFEVGLGDTDVQIPDTLDLRGYSNREHHSNYQRIQWIYKGGAVENSVQIYHSRLKLDDDFNIGKLSDLLKIKPEQVPLLFPGHTDEILSAGLKNSFSERYDIEFEQKGRIKKADYVWGIGARSDKVKSPTLFGKEEKTENRYRLFGNLDWRINEKINANLGVLMEHTPLTDLVFSPRLSINLHPSKQHTFRFSITKGKRVPAVTFQDLNTTLRFKDGTIIDTDTIGSNSLKTETLIAYEAAYIATMPKINSQFEVKVFREELSDLVGLQINPFNDIDKQVRIWDNRLNSTIQGFEVQATHQFSQLSGLKAQLAYAYFDTSGRVLRDSRDPSSIRKTFSVPRHSTTLLLSKKLSNAFDISSTLQYQSDYENRNVAIKRVDLRLGKKIKFPNSSGKVSFVIQNAFNKYNDFSERNVFKTRTFLQLQLDF